MMIKSIVIEGQNGNIEIARTETGAYVMDGKVYIAHFDRHEPHEVTYTKAVEVAKAIYGTDRRGRALATNSMMHDIINEIQRVAG